MKHKQNLNLNMTITQGCWVYKRRSKKWIVVIISIFRNLKNLSFATKPALKLSNLIYSILWSYLPGSNRLPALGFLPKTWCSQSLTKQSSEKCSSQIRAQLLHVLLPSSELENPRACNHFSQNLLHFRSVGCGTWKLDSLTPTVKRNLLLQPGTAQMFIAFLLSF